MQPFTTTLPAPYSQLVDQTQASTPLPADDRYSEAGHTWSEAEVQAVVQAWGSGRPLLVRGEAGCGKSQLARALAAVWQVKLITEVIHPRYEATDLLYREDPVRRLAQAQLLAAVKPVLAEGQNPLGWLQQQLAPEKFVDQGPLWRATLEPAPRLAAAKQPAWPRAVVLIDEIDKADSDLPNALLDVLGNRSFCVPASGQTVSLAQDHPPFIVVTTNEDRELPPAFVRRCAVLNLRPADAGEGAFSAWLAQRAAAHPKLKAFEGHALLQRAAGQVWADRSAATALSLPTVGLAEYLDLLYSLHRLSGGEPRRAEALLDRLAPFALVKHRDQDQARVPVAAGAPPAQGAAEHRRD